jgi:hypothetical protein
MGSALIYNVVMRKKRSDRNHVIYVIENVMTGDKYIGLTVVSGSVRKSVKVRFQKHVSRAKMESKNWSLCDALREWGPECFEASALTVVRGRALAHTTERDLIRTFQPSLNTF